MVNKFKDFSKSWLSVQSLIKIWPILALFIISTVLCAVNYSPGTFLSGWDTLHPEFDFGLNFQRIFFGVFRIEQGLGAVAGHSHMADLPRILILYAAHFVLPMSFLRYFYIFLNLIFGPLGMYLLLTLILGKFHTPPHERPHGIHVDKIKSASFLGGLFYLLNLGTLQTFNVPFEMFTTLFATLPFVFYFAIKYLTQKNMRVKNLLFFSISIIFTSPSAYAATLWYVFFGIFLAFIFSLYLLHFKAKTYKLKDVLILLSTTILLNFYWLIPNLYFVLYHATDVQNANINFLFSGQAFLKNKEFGDIVSILFLKTFYFDWNIFNGTKFEYLLLPYINYLKNIPILALGYGFGISIIIGIFATTKKLKKDSIPFFIVLLISLFFLINDNFPLSPIFKFFQEHVPFFKEALRFPGDKILNIYTFLASIYFGFFAFFIIEKLKRFKWQNFIFVIGAVLLILTYNLPSFGGNLINKYMKIDLPNNYFELFDYLKTQKNDLKVANLPINSQWGWVYYNWSENKPDFQGAGFLYFGIDKPLLDRDFDRWSPYNESYYREMSYALYKEDVPLLRKVIEKYKIGFIFIDHSVIEQERPASTLFLSESKYLISKTGLVEETKNFGKITLFKLKTNPNLIEAKNTNININPKTKTIYSDAAYQTYGNYISTAPSENLYNLTYPFREIIDNQSRLLPDILKIDNEKISLNPLVKIKSFETKDFENNLNIVPADIILEKNKTNLAVSIYPNTPIFDQTPSSSSIKTVLDLGKSKENKKLSVNDNELFELNNLIENSPTAIGKILLKNTLNEIAVFDNSFTPIENSARIINPFFSNCGGTGTPPTVLVSENGINLKTKGTICILIPYGYFDFIANPEQHLLTNFSFNLSSNKKITSCLYNQETSSCLFYREPKINGNNYTFTYALKAVNAKSRALQIIIEDKSKKEQSLTLTNINASYSKAISSTALLQSALNDVFKTNSNFTFKNIYLPNNIVYSPGFEITSLKNLTNNCPNAKNAQKEIVTENGIKTIKYSADDSNYCDNFSYPNLLHKLGYLVVVNSKNETGLPLSFCITNYTTRKCDIYTNLGEAKNFSQQVFLLPPTDPNGLGYDINIEDIGIPKSPSVNYLASIEFIPIPYEFLTNMKQSNSKTPQTFNGKVVLAKEYNPDMYYVKTDSNPLILALGYSYEEGFRAYEINCESSFSCFIKTLISPFVSKELPHVLVNNWENGWITSSKTSHIAIVFLPQYLEWMGLLVVIFIILYLALKSYKRKQ